MRAKPGFSGSDKQAEGRGRWHSPGDAVPTLLAGARSSAVFPEPESRCGSYTSPSRQRPWAPQPGGPTTPTPITSPRDHTAVCPHAARRLGAAPAGQRGGRRDQPPLPNLGLERVTDPVGSRQRCQFPHRQAGAHDTAFPGPRKRAPVGEVRASFRAFARQRHLRVRGHGNARGGAGGPLTAAAGRRRRTTAGDGPAGLVRQPRSQAAVSALGPSEPASVQRREGLRALRARASSAGAEVPAPGTGRHQGNCLWAPEFKTEGEAPGS